jgi:hypothetical protein
MPTPKECRHHAEECMKLAGETSEIYAKMALIELANEFRAMAEYLERETRPSRQIRRRSTSTRHARR